MRLFQLTRLDSLPVLVPSCDPHLHAPLFTCNRSVLVVLQISHENHAETRPVATNYNRER
jgi:hypothetical protein